MDALIVTLVDTFVVPIANAVPFLVSSGALFVAFAAMWVAFGAALVRDAGRLDDLWRRIRRLPRLVQGVVWLLLLPILAGVWTWRTRWPLAARLAVIAGLAGWNLLVMLPQAA